MGMFDTVYVSNEVVGAWRLRCGACECGEFIASWIKFVDGAASECRPERPELPAEFFAGAGDLFS